MLRGGRERRDAVSASSTAYGLESDTHLFVDACIERVRETALLDQDPVLPALPPLPIEAQRREPVVFATHEGPPISGPTVATAQPPRRASRWPIFLCAFVASAAGTASLLASPVGERPAIRRVTEAVRSQATVAADGVVAFVREWV